jgi:hypothetical protein
LGLSANADLDAQPVRLILERLDQLLVGHALKKLAAPWPLFARMRHTAHAGNGHSSPGRSQPIVPRDPISLDHWRRVWQRLFVTFRDYARFSEPVVDGKDLCSDLTCQRQSTTPESARKSADGRRASDIAG